MPSDMAFRCHFGSWSKALIVAGFKPTKFMPTGKTKGCRNKKRKKVEVLGYHSVYEPNHPMSMRNGYIRLHRKIMFDAGIFTDKSLEIHHKNGNKKDNRIENLEVISKAYHCKITHLGKKRMRLNSTICWYKTCEVKTGSKYGLCTKHYKSQWQKVKNEIIGNIYENPELLEA